MDGQLPGMPTHLPTLTEWMELWLHTNYPGVAEYDRAKVRQEMLNDLPYRLVPSHNSLTRGWWVESFNKVSKRLGMAFIGGRDGDKLAVQLTLEWNDFAAVQVAKLRLAAGDVWAVERALQQYLADHPSLQVNVQETMHHWRTLAGLAA